MPITNLSDNKFPEWAELEYYDIIHLNNGHTYTHRRKSNKEVMFIGRGVCEFEQPSRKIKLGYGDKYVCDSNALKIVTLVEKSIIIILPILAQGYYR